MFFPVLSNSRILSQTSRVSWAKFWQTYYSVLILIFPLCRRKRVREEDQAQASEPREVRRSKS
jgi:hypothetical protein